jgi:hypothetical protein
MSIAVARLFRFFPGRLVRAAAAHKDASAKAPSARRAIGLARAADHPAGGGMA